MTSLNEFFERVFELSWTQVKTYGGGVTDLNPAYPYISLYTEVLYQYKVQDTFRALSVTKRSKQCLDRENNV